jgi:serine/threonine-protein kinase
VALSRTPRWERLTTPERWIRIRSATEAYLAQPPERRAAFLLHELGDDASLRVEIETLAAACEAAAQSEDFLAEPAMSFFAPLLPGVIGRHAAKNSATQEAALRTAVAGRYDIERELGRGGTATVYLARDTRHGRLVALKVLDPSLGAAMSGERFLREIRVTAGLTHPHILPLHDSGVAAGLMYYVMPYIDGETLRDRLAGGQPLPLDAARRLIREVASALDYAHRHGVVHRDIKPANILFEEGHAVVADFGIARAVRRAREPADAAPHAAAVRGWNDERSDPLTQGGVTPGTPAYMAPEQARGNAEVDHRADIYALGIVAYQALAGEHPFGTRTPLSMARAHAEEAPPHLATRRPDAQPSLTGLVMQALEKDPSDRQQSAAEIVAMLDGVPGGAEPVAGSGPARSATVRNRRRIIGTAIGIIAIGSLVGVNAWMARHVADDTAARSTASTPTGDLAIAVLPFANTGDARDDYFGDGLTDELTQALARIPGVRLAGRASVYAFKGKNVAARDIGRALAVRSIIDGTIHRDGDRMHVTVRLVSAADGKVLWSRAYDDRASDVLAMQDELTRNVRAALAPTLQGTGTNVSVTSMDVARGTSDPGAYELYLRGHYYWTQRGLENINRSIDYFQRAIARDSLFARAQAGLAIAYSSLPVYASDTDADTATLDVERARELAAKSAQRATALDSTLGEAQLAMGVSLDMRLRFQDALAHYRRAVALDPASVTAHHWLGVSLLNMGYTDKALAELHHATELDPLAPTPASALATALLFARRFDEARTASRRALAIDSAFGFAIYTLGLAQALDGQPDSAVIVLERGARLHPRDTRMLSALTFAYAAAGRWNDAASTRGEIHRRWDDRRAWMDVAPADAIFGDPEPLLRAVEDTTSEQAYVESGGLFGCNPLLDPVQSSARFRAAMRKLAVVACPPPRTWPLRSHLNK